MKKLFFIGLFFLSWTVQAQEGYVNIADTVYKFGIANSGCSLTPAFTPCAGSSFYSIAYFKDTLYYNSNGTLYRKPINGIACEQLVSGFNGNNLTITAGGTLFCINSDRNLVSYNIYTGVPTTHGVVPYSPGGDLLFYAGKLLLAGSPANIYEINIVNPSLSTLFMNTNGRQFYGLTAQQAPCGPIRYFGLEPQIGNTNIVELDLGNRVILNTVCSVPIPVLDAASNAETGVPFPLNFSEIKIDQNCATPQISNIVLRSNTYDPTLVYTMNGQNPNNNGIFNNVPSGIHTFRIATPNGLCFKDSTISTGNLPKPVMRYDIQQPQCNIITGSLLVAPLVAANSYQYAFNNNNFSANNQFLGLAPSTYPISIKSNFTCTLDTMITISPNNVNPISKSVQITNADCSANNSGALLINAIGNQTPYYIVLNGVFYPNNTRIQNLTNQNYAITILNKDTCKVDSFTVTINLIETPECYDVYIPNAFTPNGDGKNDILKPKIGIANQQIDFKIFNRYGVNVYAHAFHNPQWDGKYKGQLQPNGVYVYQLRYIDKNGQRRIHKGTLLLLN